MKKTGPPLREMLGVAAFFGGLIAIIYGQILCYFVFHAWSETGSFFPSIKGPYYAVFKEEGITVVEYPGACCAPEDRLGEAAKGERLRIIGFVKTGGIPHSWVVEYAGNVGFIKE